VLPPAAAGAAERVAVYRGSASNVPAPIPVYRGSAVAPGARGANVPEPGVGAVGGQRLWFVDPAQDELVACRLEPTLTVGHDRIRCTRRRLPTN
jgi:hypothetical protein